MGDLLFPVRNLFYLGSYQGAINEAQDLEGLSEVDSTERDVFVYRSYIALGSAQLVISEISDSAPLALTAVKLFAEYTSKAKSKDDCVATLQSWMEDPAANNNATACLMAGLVYAREGNHVEALKACHGANSSLEMQALSVQVLLAMDRPDQAEKGVKAMSNVDDDATLTQLATAWTGLALGGAKVQEAAYIYQELGDKYTWTAQLHAGLAAANMRMGRWEEAETDLQDALKKDDKDAEALANLVAVLLHRGKAYERHLKQLRMQAPQHPFLSRWDSAGEALDRAAMAAG